MTRRQKISLAAFVGVALIFAGTVTAFFLSFHNAGELAIDVRETKPGGDQVSVRIPGGLVKAALLLVPDRVLCEPARAVRNRAPLLRAATKELARSEDAVFVEVESADESVRVAKEGEHLVIRVESNEESIRVRVPMRLVGAILERLERVRVGVSVSRGGESA